MPPLVSILIPAYNAEAWLAETIESAMAQTWSRKEIIVVNDGSADATLAVAQRFAAASVRVVDQPHAGAAATRNNLASLAQGDYIQWLDADDLMAPDKITHQMAEVERVGGKHTLYSSSWGHFLFRTRKAKFIPTRLWENLTPLEWMLRKWEDHVFMQTATWLVSRELTAGAGPWNTKLLSDDDGEYFSRVLKISDRVQFVPAAKVYYRIVGSNSLSYIGASHAKMEAHFAGMKTQIAILRSLSDDQRARAACVKYLQTWLVHFYPSRMDIVEQARQLAAELGGQLHAPDLPWKYAWIEKTLGWGLALRAKSKYNRWKWDALRAWDRAMLDLENRKTV